MTRNQKNSFVLLEATQEFLVGSDSEEKWLTLTYWYKPSEVAITECNLAGWFKSSRNYHLRDLRLEIKDKVPAMGLIFPDLSPLSFLAHCCFL